MIVPTDEEMAIFELERVHIKKNNPLLEKLKVDQEDFIEIDCLPSLGVYNGYFDFVLIHLKLS